MAQQKNVPAKSQVKSKPKSAPAVSVKATKKMSEPKAAKSKPSASKQPAKVAGKAKPSVSAQAAKPAAKAKVAVKPVAKAPVKVAKVADKKVAAPVQKAAPKAVKPEVKTSAAAPAVPTKPVASAAAPASSAAAPVRPGIAPQPNAVKNGQPQPVRAPAASFAGANVARSLSAPAAKPAVRTFPAPAAAATPRDLAAKAADARQQQIASAALAAAKKPVTARHGFKINESIVYPAHGVGRIVGIEEQEIAGMSLELFVIQFEKDKMTLRVPTGKLQSVGMRKLAEDDIVTKAMETLKGRARVKRTMWSRRAQEYEAKINSGDLVSIAEVVRDLYRSESQPEQSYSERQLYEAALDRMAREIAAVARIDERGASQRITEVLSKSAKGRRAAETVVEAADPIDANADAKAA